jgi:hypothetical protein
LIRHKIETNEGEVIICDRCKREIEYPERFEIVYDEEKELVHGIFDVDCADILEENNWVDGKIQMATSPRRKRN